MQRGTCGDNLTWQLEGGKLTISGTGKVINDWTWNTKYDELIKEVVICDGATSLDRGAFYKCMHLKTVTLPASVITIGDKAFFGCKSLFEVNLHLGLKSFGEGVFSECTRLIGIKIPPSVESVGRGIFWGCLFLKAIYYPAGCGFEKILTQGNNAELIAY